MKKLLIFVLLFISHHVFSQELVIDGDFEVFRKQSGLFPLCHLKNWKNPTFSSPDYQTAKYKWGGNKLKAFSGESYIALVFGGGFDYAEYAQGSFEKKLVKDSLYCVSMYVCLSPFSTISPFGVDVMFSKGKIGKFTKKHLGYKYNPSILEVGQEYIKNRYSWQKISSVYKATGNEKFIVIGKFHDENYTKVDFEERSIIFDQAFMFIDKLSVLPISDSSECDCNIKRMDLGSVLSKKTLIPKEDSILIFKEGTRIELRKVFFEHASSDLKAESGEELDKLYALLQKYPSLEIQLNGYTDNTGSLNANVRLSKKRAKAVVDYLSSKGIEAQRLKYKGSGPDNPLESNETEEGRARNRRVEFFVLSE